jgi:hypothetical protein
LKDNIQQFCILYKMGNNNNDDNDSNNVINDDNDNDNNNNTNNNGNNDNVEEADGVLMTVAWPITPSRAATLMEN